MSERIIVTEDLCKTINNRAIVKNVCLEIPEGEIYGLIGPNGAGKTTLLLLLTGFYRPTKGAVYINGMDIAENPNILKKSISYLPKKAGFYDLMTARENLEFFASLYDFPPEECQRLSAELLEHVALSEAAEEPVKTFTPGMVKRLALAKALLHEPQVLLIDEPFLDMDLLGVEILNKLIMELARAGKTVVVSADHLSEVLPLFSKVGILYEGELLYQGPREQFIETLKTSCCRYELRFATKEQAELVFAGAGLNVVVKDGVRLVVSANSGYLALQGALENLEAKPEEIIPLEVSLGEHFLHYFAEYRENKAIGGDTFDENTSSPICHGVTSEEQG